MLRHVTCLSLLFALAATAAAQPAKQTLISVEKNINRYGAIIKSKDVTPDCDIPWSVTMTTLRGGKQQGCQLITINNGKMQIVVIPTRGMGIHTVTLALDQDMAGRDEKSIKLGWQSPVTEIVHPRHINLNLRGGLGWLEGFNEWLARCGLENTGQAGQDEIVNNVGDKAIVDLTLHGKIANIPASEVELLVQQREPYRITLRGIVHEKMLFGPKLELVTEISTEAGSEKFRIEDKVINRGSQPTEFQILYHYNFGKPLLGEGAKLHVPVDRVTPYNANAARDVKSWHTFAGPKSGYVEQVYLMRPLDDEDGNVRVLLANPKGNRGLQMKYPKKQLPYLTLWKNTGADEDGYVIGIEPGVSFPNARKVERQAGRVPKLGGGASHSMRMDFAFVTSRVGVDMAVRQIEDLQRTQAAKIDDAPEGR